MTDKSIFNAISLVTLAFVRKYEWTLFAWHVWMFFVTLAVTVLWILDTYTSSFNRNLLLCRGIAASIFLLDFIKENLISLLMREKQSLMTWIFNLLTIAAIVMTFLTIGTLSAIWPNLDFLYVVKFHRFWHLSKRFLSREEDSISPLVFAMIEGLIIIVILCVVFSGAFITVENNMALTTYNFFDALYFVIVTFSTVGYGDRVAQSDLGKFLTTIIIIVGVGIIGSTISQIASLVADHRRYQQFRGVASEGPTPHILICGDLTYEKIRTVISELYVGSRTQDSSRVVILSETTPDDAILTYLSSPFLSSMVTYLVGKVENPADLKRTAIEHAAACFILSEEKGLKRDAEIVMKALTIHQHSVAIEASRKFNPKFEAAVGGKRHSLPIICQLHHKQYEKFVSRQGVHAICIEELKTLVLSYNMLLPGFSTFISTICQSDSPEEETIPESRREFEEGKKQEIYSVHLKSSFFENHPTFAEVSHKIYDETGALLFALVTPKSEGAAVILNPAGDYYPSGDEIFIALSEDEAALQNVVSGGHHRPEENYGETRESHLLVSKKRKNFKNVSESEDEGEEEKTELKSSRKKDLSEPSETLDFGVWEPHRVPLSIEHTQQYKQSYEKGIHKISRWEVQKKGHFIVAGNFEGLEYVLKVLRDPDLDEIKHVVLLGENPPKKRFWRWDKDLTKVYFVRGSPTSTYDWRKVSVGTAARVLLLADPESESDSTTILSYMACKAEAGPDCVITTEILSEASCQFLDSEIEVQNFWSSPAFMSGRVFCGSIFDRIVVFGFFNEYLVDLLHLMITRETGEKEQNSQSWFIGVPVPETFVGKAYNDFFDYCVLFSAIPVCLYRTPNKGESYAYTNPNGQIILNGSDIAMVLVPFVLVTDERKFQNFKQGNTEFASQYRKEKKKPRRIERSRKQPLRDTLVDVDDVPLDQELEKLRRGDDVGDVPYTRLDND